MIAAAPARSRAGDVGCICGTAGASGRSRGGGCCGGGGPTAEAGASAGYGMIAARAPRGATMAARAITSWKPRTTFLAMIISTCLEQHDDGVLLVLCVVVRSYAHRPEGETPIKSLRDGIRAPHLERHQATGSNA